MVSVEMIQHSSDARKEAVIVDENWISTGKLREIPHGVDLEVINPPFPIAYEDRCFDVVAELEPGGLWMGPHLTDYVFGRNPDTNSLIRPDAIRFIEYGHTWMITHMAEFKSGARNGKNRKLRGFSHLLQILRNDSTQITNSIRRTLGIYYEVPELITALPDAQVPVYFLSPYVDPYEDYQGQAPFPVALINVPRGKSQVIFIA